MSELSEEKSPSSPTLSRRISEFLSRPKENLDSIIHNVCHQLLSWRLAERYGVKVSVRRDDAIHSQLSGNKLYKLWGHYCRYKASYEGLPIVSFGGAFSNHLHALAALGCMTGVPTIGIIRGEEPGFYSSTLLDLKKQGMKLYFISRSEYMQHAETAFHATLSLRYQLPPRCYWIPEGGGGDLGMLGCESLGRYLANTPYDVIAQACGTGTTLAGIANGLVSSNSVVVPALFGFSALKSNALHVRMLNEALGKRRLNCMISNQYHCGGFAKSSRELTCFIREFEEETGLILDRVYTGKMFLGLSHMIRNGVFNKGTHILAIHSGGLQGNRPIPQRDTRLIEGDKDMKV